MKKSLEKDISSLMLEDNILKILKDNQIVLINDLWNLSRKNLKELGLKDNEIHQIIVKLQLNGIDLGKKIYAMS